MPPSVPAEEFVAPARVAPAQDHTQRAPRRLMRKKLRVIISARPRGLNPALFLLWGYVLGYYVPDDTVLLATLHLAFVCVLTVLLLRSAWRTERPRAVNVARIVTDESVVVTVTLTDLPRDEDGALRLPDRGTRSGR